MGLDKRSLNSQLDGAFGSAFLLFALINDFDIYIYIRYTYILIYIYKKHWQSSGESNCVKSLSVSLISSVENARRDETRKTF